MLAVVATSGTIGYLRNAYLPRRRVGRFLRAQGVEFLRVDGASSYGWPSYVVVFDTVEKSATFRRSPVFDALVREVQTMHESLRHGGARFDATQAVNVSPPT